MDEPLARRAPREQILTVGKRFRSAHPLAAIMDAIPASLLVVNDYRQVVHANRQASEVIGSADVSCLLGRLPGELLNCVHVAEGRHGCGSSEACKVCGAAKALSAAEHGQASVQECRIRRTDNGVLDLRVSATPIQFDGQTYTIVALTDISSENRRKNLERIFFHDLMNTLGALTGYVQLLDGAQGQDARELSEAILRLTETLAEEIRAQRDLAAAENNDLAVHLELLNSREILEQVAVQYRTHTVGRGRSITLGTPLDLLSIRTDRRLLQRILANMVKNALEASDAGSDVTLRCERLDGKVTFSVHNHGEIPRDVQIQIFGRAFSTKGVGRGLGTYSMKLLGERYLGGRVSFTSTAQEGTIFRVELPV